MRWKKTRAFSSWYCFWKASIFREWQGVLSVSFGTKAAVLGSDDIVEIFFFWIGWLWVESVTLHVMSWCSSMTHAYFASTICVAAIGMVPFGCNVQHVAIFTSHPPKIIATRDYCLWITWASATSFAFLSLELQQRWGKPRSHRWDSKTICGGGIVPRMVL